MERKLCFAGAMLAVLLTFSTTAPAEMISAYFNDGNSTAYVDGYRGKAGDGWAAGWVQGQGNPSGVTISTNRTVTSAAPFSAAEGNYLRMRQSVTGSGAASPDYSPTHRGGE